MKTIAIITRHPEAIAAYLGFGFTETERGTNKFSDNVVIISGPDQHAEWQSCRLGSGMHGARIVDDFSTWAAEWGYTPHYQTLVIHDGPDGIFCSDRA